MKVGNTLCSICARIAAEVFCPCTTPESFLCVGCIGLHYVKRTERAHTTWPITQLPYYKIPGYPERLQTRLELFQQVRTQALQSLEIVDKAIQEFSNEMERTSWQLIQLSLRTLEELNRTKAELASEVEVALGEVERTLVEERPQLTTQYGNALRGLTEEFQQFQLFSYSLLPSCPQAVVPFQFKVYPPAKILTEKKLIAFYQTHVDIYDLHFRRKSSHSIGGGGPYSSYIGVDDKFGLIVDYGVLGLDLTTFQVTDLAPLAQPRKSSGLIKVENCVYALGGRQGPLCKISSACEKWDIRTKVWTRITNMNYGRSYFTPCSFKTLIYLASADIEDGRSVETFDPLKELFTVLEVSLPPQLGAGSVAFVVNGELCLLTTNKQMAQWKIESEREFRLTAIDRKCGSRQQPFIIGTNALIVFEDMVQKFDLKTFTFF